MKVIKLEYIPLVLIPVHALPNGKANQLVLCVALNGTKHAIGQVNLILVIYDIRRDGLAESD